MDVPLVNFFLYLVSVKTFYLLRRTQRKSKKTLLDLLEICLPCLATRKSFRRVVLISGFVFQSQEFMNTELVNRTEPPTICSKQFVNTLVNQGTENNSVHLNLAKEYIHKVVSCFISLDSS